jgi:restriction endonuclease S subunit
VDQGDIRVMSVAALRNGAPPRFFAELLDVAQSDFAQPGDVLVAIEGGTVGETLVVPDDFEPFVPSQQAAACRIVNSSTLDPWYLGAWLTTEPATEQLRRLARGAGIQRIPLKELSSLIVPVAPINTQHEIGERFRAFDTAIRSHKAVAACLEELRTADLIVSFADETSPTTPTRNSRKGKSNGN